MGCIYTLGRQPGTLLWNNVCHDVESYGYGGWGYYTDEGSSNITVQNNIVFHTKCAGFHQHYGTDNLIINNIIAFPGYVPCSMPGCDIAAIRSSQHPVGQDQGSFSSFTFMRNIAYIDKSDLFFSSVVIGFKNMTFDNNVYWNTVTHENIKFGPTQAPETFQQWQSEGKDVHSIVVDPLFVDPTTFDFELQHNSPALTLGFVPISTSQVGPQG